MIAARRFLERVLVTGLPRLGLGSRRQLMLSLLLLCRVVDGETGVELVAAAVVGEMTGGVMVAANRLLKSS